MELSSLPETMVLDESSRKTTAFTSLSCPCMQLVVCKRDMRERSVQGILCGPQ